MKEYRAKVNVFTLGADIYNNNEYQYIREAINTLCHTIYLDEDADPMISRLSASSIGKPVQTKLINFCLDFCQPRDDAIHKVMIAELERYKKKYEYPDEPWLRKHIVVDQHTLAICTQCVVVIKLLDVPEESQLRIFSGTMAFKYTPAELRGISLYGLDLTEKMDTSPELYIAATALAHDHLNSVIDVNRARLDNMVQHYASTLVNQSHKE